MRIKLLVHFQKKDKSPYLRPLRYERTLLREFLLKIGVNRFEFCPDTTIRKKIRTGELQGRMKHSAFFGLHAKSMVIDGKTTVIGTFNFDPRSA